MPLSSINSVLQHVGGNFKRRKDQTAAIEVDETLNFPPISILELDNYVQEGRRLGLDLEESIQFVLVVSDAK